MRSHELFRNQWQRPHACNTESDPVCPLCKSFSGNLDANPLLKRLTVTDSTQTFNLPKLLRLHEEERLDMHTYISSLPPPFVSPTTSSTSPVLIFGLLPHSTPFAPLLCLSSLVSLTHRHILYIFRASFICANPFDQRQKFQQYFQKVIPFFQPYSTSPPPSFSHFCL